MNEIGSVQAAERPAPIVAPILAATPPTGIARDTRTPLEPAVTLDLSDQAPPAAASSSEPGRRTGPDYRTQFVRDADTRALVYQVVDPASGDIVVQLPTVTVLKARAYAEVEATRKAEAGRDKASSAALDLSA